MAKDAKDFVAQRSIGIPEVTFNKLDTLRLEKANGRKEYWGDFFERVLSKLKK